MTSEVKVAIQGRRGDLKDGVVATEHLEDAAVEKEKLGSGFIAMAVAAGGSAGNITVTGITTDDELIGVLEFDTGVPANLTSEFSITAADTINNAEGTDTTGNTLVILYQDRS